MNIHEPVLVVGPAPMSNNDAAFYWHPDRMDCTIGRTLLIRETDEDGNCQLEPMPGDDSWSEDTLDMLEYYWWMPEWLQQTDPECETDLAALLN